MALAPALVGMCPELLSMPMETVGLSTEHARAAREGFARQVGRLTRVDAETSIAISHDVDLARAALYVVAEDDSLVSRSPSMPSSSTSTTSPSASSLQGTSRPLARRPRSSSTTSTTTSTSTRDVEDAEVIRLTGLQCGDLLST